MASVDNVYDIAPINKYVASSGQTVFDYDFPIFDAADLRVYVGDVLQSIGTDYTVQGEGNENGGTVTFTSGRSSGQQITIYRLMPIERLTDMAQNGPMRAADFNQELDRITMYLQEVRRDMDRSLRFGILGNSPSPELSPIDNWKDRYLYVNSSGALEPSVNVGTTPLSQGVIGQFLYPQTAAEVDAGVTPVNFAYPDSPERYGAIGDGVADDTVALQRWASIPGFRSLGPKTYKCSQRISFAKHATVKGDGMGSSIIDFTGALGPFTGNRCVDFSQGSLMPIPATSGNPAEGDSVLSFVSDHGLSQGDIVFLHNPASGSWSPHLATYTKGEACVVAEVISATQVGLMAALKDDYTSSATNAYRLDPCYVDIEGFSIKGVGTDSPVMGMFISHAASPRIRNVSVTASGLTATTIRYSFDVESNGFVSHQYYEGSEVGTGQYGVSLIHCQDVRLKGSFQGERHAVTTGSTSGAGGIVNRNILVHDSHLKSLIDCAADFHGNTELSGYDNCTIDGAVVLGGNRNYCRNSTITGRAGIRQGQPITFRELRGLTFDLSNLQCKTLADPHATGGVGVLDICGQDSTALTANTILGGTLTVNNVKIDAPNAHAGARLVNRGCTQDLDVRVNGLHMNIASDTTAAFGSFRIDNISGGNFRSISLYNFTATPDVKRSRANFDVDNILWEHDKGTFTPGVSFGGGVTGVAYALQYGFYELTGSTVSFEIHVLLSSKGSSTGNAAITGLPYPVSANSNSTPIASIQGSAMTFDSVLSAIVNQGSSNIVIQEVSTSGALSAITDADFTNSTRIRVSGSYQRAV